ncbi:SRPBCC family protein [Paenibacillus harenae]|uniref:SRPBCC family protein n=1 Tax=Paenibacillus harenae TaxID=306543 RepID=UPI002792C61B|nr:SRPBCC family protein [Paenibacillus harenae]MDQ0059129.1 putative membrane protein [Paenibacillus harenae]
MVDVLTEITINCPCDQVSEYAANPDNASEWYVNIKSVEWQTPKPIEVGSKIAFKAAFLGKELSYVYEIAEYTPGRKLVMRTADGPFPMETTYTWESLSGHSTRMTLRNKGNPSGFSILFTPFMSLMMKKANNKDLKRIKFLLEERSS